jgi:hypothetical protein
MLGEARYHTSSHLEGAVQMSKSDSGTSLVPSSVVFDLLEEEEPDRWVTRPGLTRLVATPLMPGGALGTPMTYMLDGHQYIALTVGGEVPSLAAFRLPD